ncbi:hypothetical protein [Halohasta salina]|uniref:hypothetical protein n=1 Tax=Halohasta salina TaxID=2961621 RepID=UPI0020A4AD87|nr:hypothetical protein [Halohasta salina]
MGIGEFLEENGEKVKLGVYFLVVIGVGGMLFSTLGEAWRRAELAKPLILSLDPLVGVSLEQFAAGMFGLYLGLLALMIADPKKRIQGVLLGFGTAAALVGLLSVGLFIPNIDFGANIVLIVGGIVAGTILGGGQQLLEVRTADALEFRRAASRLYFVLTGIIVVGMIEYHVTFPQLLAVSDAGVSVQNVGGSLSFTQSGMFVNGLMSVVFVLTLREFVQYDSSETFFVLGPRASGKSLLLVGKYLAALDDATDRKADTPMNPSGDLMELVSSLDAVGQDAGWEIRSTASADVKDLRFNFTKGRVFPKNVEIESLDYAGEYLDELPNALMSADDEIDNSTLRLLAQRVRDAETLILVIDMERYHRNESLGIEPYFDILDEASGTDVLLVATKCDILAEQFRDERALEAHQYFDEFQEYVNKKLVANDQTVRTLVQNTAGNEIHPVYYQTKVDDAGDRVPMRDPNGNVMTIGFDELLKKVG